MLVGETPVIFPRMLCFLGQNVLALSYSSVTSFTKLPEYMLTDQILSLNSFVCIILTNKAFLFLNLHNMKCVRLSHQPIFTDISMLRYIFIPGVLCSHKAIQLSLSNHTILFISVTHLVNDLQRIKQMIIHIVIIILVCVYSC